MTTIHIPTEGKNHTIKISIWKDKHGNDVLEHYFTDEQGKILQVSGGYVGVNRIVCTVWRPKFANHLRYRRHNGPEDHEVQYGYLFFSPDMIAKISELINL